MADKIPIYDPTDYQLQNFERVELEQIDLTHPVDPQIVGILIHNYKSSLIEIKSLKQQSKTDNDNILDKSNGITKLQVELAKNGSTEIISWAEIFISLLGGYGINSIFGNPSNYVGWFMLGICVVILFIFRTPRLINELKGRKNGN
jgi:uncharacterized membrane protein YobD (UPF0266 family)